MKAGSMEGLIGASLNMKLTRTPMRVFREAERRGDTDAMKRSMGYVTDFQEKAQECSDRAQEELGKELEEERREEEIRRKKAQERGEAAKEYAEKVQKKNEPDSSEKDSVEISEEGKVVLKNSSRMEEYTPPLEKTDVKMYTEEGKAVQAEPAEESDERKIDVTV